MLGYSKAEAQIEFLRTLQTWCPFYGSTFFTINCQYDDNPTDVNSDPPLQPMTLSITAKAIFLISHQTHTNITHNTNKPLLTSSSIPLTTTDSGNNNHNNNVVIIRQPYNRIIKWVTHIDKNILCYWILKTSYTIIQINKIRSDCVDKNITFDPNRYCDCVYIVSNEIYEIDFLLKTNMDMLKGVIKIPLLPGDIDDDVLATGNMYEEGCNYDSPIKTNSQTNKMEEKSNTPQRRSSTFGALFNVFNGLSEDGHEANAGAIELQKDITSTSFGDDTTGIHNSVFKGVYGVSNSGNNNPSSVNHRTSLADLHKQLDELALHSFEDLEYDNDESDDERESNNNKNNSGSSDEDNTSRENNKNISTTADSQPKRTSIFGNWLK
jgi:hypothetical protein